MTFRRVVGAVVAASLALAVAACGDEVEPPVDQAQPAVFESMEDISTASRKRLKVWVVAPEVETVDQAAQTAMKVAMAYYQEHLPQFVTVILKRAPDSVAPSAVADYAPDQFGVDGQTALANGTWQISAADPKSEGAPLTPYTPQ